MIIGGTNHWAITFLTNKLMERPRPSIDGLARVVLRSDLATFHDGVDFTLRLRLVDAVLGHDLSNEIVLVLERAELLLGELAPFGADILEKNLLRLSRIAGARRSGIWGY